MALTQLLFVGVCRDDPIHVYVDRKRQVADLKEAYEVACARVALVKDHDVLDEVQVEERTFFFRPGLAKVQQKYCFATVEIEP